MECEPEASVEILKVAEPAVRVAVPRVVEPSVKVTVPVGVPPAEVTVAVNVSVLPNTAELADPVNAVVVLVVAAAVTVCVSTADVLAVKFASPL